MNLLQIKQAVLALDNSELRELNSYVVDRNKQIAMRKKSDFYVGQKIECQGDIFVISKLNRSRAKCIKDSTGERYNIPFSMMSVA